MIAEAAQNEMVSLKKKTAEVKFIWNVSAYALNMKTLCRRKARKQDFAA